MKMITKFKIFESNDENYKVGDWVYLTNWWAGQHLHDFINNTPCEIINISFHENQEIWEYECKYLQNPLINYKNPKNEEWIKEFSVISDVKEIKAWIKRKATPEEIEDYKIKTDAKKYNL